MSCAQPPAQPPDDGCDPNDPTCNNTDPGDQPAVAMARSHFGMRGFGTHRSFGGYGYGRFSFRRSSSFRAHAFGQGGSSSSQNGNNSCSQQQQQQSQQSQQPAPWPAQNANQQQKICAVWSNANYVLSGITLGTAAVGQVEFTAVSGFALIGSGLLQDTWCGSSHW